MARKKYWTTFKIATLGLAGVSLLAAIASRLKGDLDAFQGFLVIAGFFAVLFGLLNVDSTFNRGG